MANNARDAVEGTVPAGSQAPGQEGLGSPDQGLLRTRSDDAVYAPWDLNPEPAD